MVISSTSPFQQLMHWENQRFQSQLFSMKRSDDEQFFAGELGGVPGGVDESVSVSNFTI